MSGPRALPAEAARCAGSRLRVLHIVFNEVVDDPRVRRVADSLHSNGHHVEAIGFQTSAAPPSTRIADLPYRVRIVPRPPAKYFPSSWFGPKLWREWLWACAFVKEVPDAHFDVIHAHDLNVLHYAMLAALPSSTPILFDSHEIWTGLESSRGTAARTALRMYERFLIRRCAAVVSVTPGAGDHLARMHALKAPFVVTNCANWMDPANRLPKEEAWFDLLYHGSLGPGRGCHELIKAVRLMPPKSRARAVFRGSGAGLRECRAIATHEGCGTRVVFVPPVPMTMLVKAASSSHVGVVLTRDSCINNRLTVSNKLYEYAMAGLPVIMSDVPEHRRLNDEFDFGIIVKDFRPEPLAEIIGLLEDDQARYARLCEGSLRMSKACHWEREFETQMAAYRASLARGQCE